MLARIGGLLLVAGSVVIGLSVVVGWTRPGARFAMSADGPLLALSIVMLGAGAAALAIGSHPPLSLVGLGVVTVGLLAVALGFIITPVEGGLEHSWPALILVFGGGLVSLIGAVVSWVVLIRSGGRARIVGLLLLGWPVLSVGALAVPSIAEVIREVGLGFLLVGLAGVGVLAFELGAPTARLGR